MRMCVRVRVRVCVCEGWVWWACTLSVGDDEQHVEGVDALTHQVDRLFVCVCVCVCVCVAHASG
jgi:hypothetical protein